MKISYAIYSIVVTFAVLFLTAIIGDMIGPGSNELDMLL